MSETSRAFLPPAHAAPALRRSPTRSVVRLVSVSLGIACLVLWFVSFRPQALGGSASYVAVDGISMTPTMHLGDLAVVEEQGTYHIGQIIAYRIPANEPGAGMNVIHRIVGGNGTTGFITKGDHNPYTDAFWHPRTKDVIGALWFYIPMGATVLSRLHDPFVLGLFVAAVTFVVVAWPSPKTRPARARPRHRRQTAHQDQAWRHRPLPRYDEFRGSAPRHAWGTAGAPAATRSLRR